LLDAFGDSLRFVNRLLDWEFGKASRKAIAHMPHMLDKDIITGMQARCTFLLIFYFSVYT